MTNIWKNLTKNIKHGLKVLKKLVILLANKLIQEDKKSLPHPRQIFLCVTSTKGVNLNCKVFVKSGAIIYNTYTCSKI